MCRQAKGEGGFTPRGEAGDAGSPPSPVLAPLVRRHRLVIAAFLVLTAAAAGGLRLLQQDNSPEAFFVRDARALQRYRRFEFQFGRDRSLRLVLSGSGIWTETGLVWLRDLEQRAQELRGVRATAGLWRHHHWRLPQWPPTDPATFRAEVVSDLVDRNAAWVSADGELVTVLVGLYRLPPALRRQTLAQLKELLAAAPPGVESSLAGLPVWNEAMDDAVTTMARRFFPLLALLAFLLLGLIFRRPTDVLVPLLFVGVCEVVLFGAMGYAGERLNIVVIILAPLVFVISLATAVHVLACFRQLRPEEESALAATLETYRTKAWPVLWTGVTTFAGFGSLATSQVPPVRALGVWSAFGISFMTLAALTLYPSLLVAVGGSRSGPASAPFEIWGRRLGRSAAAWAIGRRRAAFAAFGTILLLALWGLTLLRIESDVRTYLRPAHPVRAALEELQSRGLGVIAAELVLRDGSDPQAGAPGLRFDGPAALQQLARLAQQLRSQSPVLGIVSAGDLVNALARYLDPGGAGNEDCHHRVLAMIRQLPALERMLAALVTRDGRWARLPILVPMLGFTELEPVFDRARVAAQDAFPGAEAWITGRYPLVLSAQKTLLGTMVVSLSLTFLIVAGVFRLVLRSLPLTLCALVPNLWPVAFVLGAMGWLGVPIDSTTVMIASVVLGLAVDDTLHTMGYLRRFAGSQRPAATVVAALERAAGAHVTTSFILAAGFAVCGLSSFVPVSRFGGLAALAIAMALLADLCLLPALLASLPERVLERFGDRPSSVR